MSQNEYVIHTNKRRVHMNNINVLAIDLAKNIFQLHGVDKKGRVQST